MRSFKLTLLVLPLLGLFAAGCAASDGEPTAGSSTEAITSGHGPSDLTTFDALTAAEKVAALFDDQAGLRPELSETPIRIVDSVPAGPDRQAALAAYFTLRDYAYANGGDAPVVSAIAKAGVTYAYSMQARGSYHSGSWGEYVVYDRHFAELTRSSYAE